MTRLPITRLRPPPLPPEALSRSTPAAITLAPRLVGGDAAVEVTNPAGLVRLGLEPEVERHCRLAELLLGLMVMAGRPPCAADVAWLMQATYGYDEVPLGLRWRLTHFDDKAFDLGVALGRLAIRTRRQRAEVLELASYIVFDDSALARQLRRAIALTTPQPRIDRSAPCADPTPRQPQRRAG